MENSQITLLRFLNLTTPTTSLEESPGQPMEVLMSSLKDGTYMTYMDMSINLRTCIVMKIDGVYFVNAYSNFNHPFSSGWIQVDFKSDDKRYIKPCNLRFFS